MSLKDQFPQEIPEETRQIVEGLLTEDSVYHLVGQEGEQMVDEEKMRRMYDEEGRPAINPVMLSLISIFQHLEKLPDRKAAEMAVMRLDWKYALRQELEWTGFHYSDLCNFRKRLMKHGQEREAFEGLVIYLRERGYIKTKGKQRSDATHIIGAVARLSRLELMWETIRVTMRAIISQDMPWVLKWLPPSFIENHTQKRNDYRLSEEEVKKQMKAAGGEGYWLLDQIDAQGAPILQELLEVSQLRRVLDEQFEREQEGKPRPRKDADCTGDVLSSPHDPDVRYGSKGGQSWRGYKLQVTETADEEQPVQFITDVEITSTLEADYQQVKPIQERLIEREIVPEKHYVDRGYTSGETIAQSQKRGINLRGEVGEGSSQKPEGFRLRDFVIEIDKQQASCPAGKQARSWSETPDAKNRVAYRAAFGAQCQGCIFCLLGLCTTSPKGRRLDINRYHDVIQARREEAQTEAFRLEMHTRAAIEGTISEMVRAHGARRARYRGQEKIRLQAYFTAAATNLKRLARRKALPLFRRNPMLLAFFNLSFARGV